ncbi:hypothetical protein AGMMS50276_24060 [Synergistales bacterium]|nr:hypothetical protein AGMMS50276_24060 [Synergistales bacterium]
MLKKCKFSFFLSWLMIAFSPLFAEALTGSQLNLFEQKAEALFQQSQAPGMAIAIVEGGQVVYAKGFGVKKLGGSDPVNPDTAFRIASCTKAFTAMGIGMLVDDGKLSWSNNVLQYLPDFRLSNETYTQDFRVDDIMSQRSGFPERAGQILSGLGYDRQYIYDTLRYIRFENPLRTQYAYQNNLFILSAALTEKVTGRAGKVFSMKGFLDRWVWQTPP